MSSVAPTPAPPAGLFLLRRHLGDALATALIAVLMTVILLGARTETLNSRLVINWQPEAVLLCAGFVFVGRLCLGLMRDHVRWPGLSMGILGIIIAVLVPHLPAPAILATAIARIIMGGGGLVLVGMGVAHRMRAGLGKIRHHIPVAPEKDGHFTLYTGWAGIILALALPILFPDRASIELATLIVIYIMLGWGLNIVVGLAGLLDLGFVAFYAVGAYAYALLALHFDFSFWHALPLAGLLGALAGFLLGLPVLRLRGDYFAIVTMGFGEIIRVFLINWQGLTGGPNGLSGIPRPSFFGIAEFARKPTGDLPTFHELFGISFDPLHRIIFLYYLIVLLALMVNVVGLRLRRLPLGRAWEALREDDIACQALGINRRNIKLAAFMISACFGGFAGAFFAARQGFISPESFTFMESAVILAIVVLGGMGSQTGVVLATLFVVFLPEYFRELESYRMVMFGLAMIGIMVFRPAGLLAHRAPGVRLSNHRQEATP